MGLHPEERAIPHVPRASHGAHAGATLTLKSNNIAEDRKKIEAFGVKILGEADQPWGHVLVFEDLDGSVLKLMNPKTLLTKILLLNFSHADVEFCEDVGFVDGVADGCTPKSVAVHPT